MKAKLIFDLNDLDDELSHTQCVKANDMAMVLWEFASNSKKSLESEIEEKNLDPYDTLELVFQRFHDLMDDHDINIDKIMI